MQNSERTKSESIGFLKDLINRRVLRITGIYLGAGWGVLQFLDWIVDRYLLSPLLVDLALTIVLSLLPSVFLIAYFHGTPGKNRWRISEKVLIPINFVISVFLVFFIFGNKNLSSFGNRITVTDEQGLKIKKIVPKSTEIRKLFLFDLRNRTGDKSLDWIESGIITMLDIDISQDPFIKIFSTTDQDSFRGYYAYQKFKDSGFTRVGDAPKMFLVKVSHNEGADYFLSGSFEGTVKDLKFRIALYNTKEGKKKKEKVFKTKDILTLVDEVTLFLKKELSLPSYKNSEIVDLKFSDMFTESLKAARLFSEGLNVVRIKNDNRAAQVFLEKAVKIDPTFTYAYIFLYTAYVRNGRTRGLKQVFKKIMDNLYKLPERNQLIVKSGYYTEIKKDPDKAISILKMLVKLYPGDIKSNSQLAFFYDIRGDYENALQNYQKILELQPNQYKMYKKIADVYKKMDDYEKALVNYKKYSEFFPGKISGILNIGKTEELLGHFEKAKEYFEKALLLEPDNVTSSLLLAHLDIKFGNFDSTEEKYKEILEMAKNYREKSSVYIAMKNLYELTGEVKKEMHMMDLYNETAGKFLAPVQIYVNKVVEVDSMLKNKKDKEVVKLLNEIKHKLPPSIDKIISMGYAKVYIQRGELKKAEASIVDIDQLIKQTGYKQLEKYKSEFIGDIAFKRGKYEKALKIYANLLKSDKYNLTLILKVSKCYLELNRLDEGLETLAQGINLSPYHPEINFYSAKFYMKKKNEPKAHEYLSRALKGWKSADPDFPAANEAQKFLDELNLREEK